MAKQQLPRAGVGEFPGLSVSRGSTGKGPQVTKIKVHSLTGRITPDLLVRAFRNVKRNRGAAGLDRVSIAMFQANLEQNLQALLRDLKTRGGYHPLPLRRVFIPKESGQGQRPLGIPAVRDRIAQEVLRLLLSPIFDRLFHDNSFGFRPGRNCHMAVEKVLEFHRAKYTHVLDADIQGFLDHAC
jgi:RNA-directed DNA polymerase